MKKLLTLFMAILMAVVLAACSSTETGSDGTDAEAETDNTEASSENEETDADSEHTDSDNEDAESGSELSGSDLGEIYQKAIDRQSEVKSLSSDIVMDQKMVFDDSGELFEFETKSNLKADYTIDPLTSYMEGTMSTTDPTTGENIDMDMEMYMLQDGMYMYDSNSEAWFELPLDGMQEMLGQTANQMDAAEQLKQLESFISEFKLEEEGDEYILTLDAAADKFTEYIIEQMDMFAAVGITEAEEDIISAITYDKVSYVIKINKETFDMTAMDMTLHMTIEEDDEKLVMETESKITFSNFNGIEEIEVPQDVIDNAINIE